MQNDAEYLRGFALFVSELFVHMNLKDTAGSGRFRTLGKAVRELLQSLMEHPTPGNIKCVCQSLKVVHVHCFIFNHMFCNDVILFSCPGPT